MNVIFVVSPIVLFVALMVNLLSFGVTVTLVVFVRTGTVVEYSIVTMMLSVPIFVVV